MSHDANFVVNVYILLLCDLVQHAFHERKESRGSRNHSCLPLDDCRRPNGAILEELETLASLTVC
jgi:hypothetical protein